nr:hypothetical protein [uncultured Rhodopila sp.]
MTELLPPDRLRQISRVMDQPAAVVRRLVPILQWSIDEQTGRPVSRWVVNEASDGGR